MRTPHKDPRVGGNVLSGENETSRGTGALGTEGSVKQRPPGLLLAALFDILDDVADRLELFGILIRNFHPELFFERHDKLDRIKRVGSQIFDERGCRGDLLGIDSQLLDDDVFDFFFNGFFRHGGDDLVARRSDRQELWQQIICGRCPHTKIPLFDD